MCHGRCVISRSYKTEEKAKDVGCHSLSLSSTKQTGFTVVRHLLHQKRTAFLADQPKDHAAYNMEEGIPHTQREASSFLPKTSWMETGTSYKAQTVKRRRGG